METHLSFFLFFSASRCIPAAGSPEEQNIAREAHRRLAYAIFVYFALLATGFGVVVLKISLLRFASMFQARQAE